MVRTCWRLVAGAAALLVFAALAAAGQNAGGSGKIGWLDNSNRMKAGLDETSCSPRLGIVARGLSRLRGADVQLLVSGASGNLPPSWQWWVDGTTQSQGCASGNVTYTTGFRSTGSMPASDSVYNAFTQAPAVPNVAVGQGGSMYYDFSPCLTPGGSALLWFAAAGGSGSARSPARSYGLFSLALDLNTGCPGDCSDPQPVCVNVQFRQPCGDPENPRGNVIGVTDANNAYDYLQVRAASVTWMSTGSTGSCPVPGGGPRAGTWTELRKTYR